MTNYEDLSLEQQKAIKYMVGTSFTGKQIAGIVGVDVSTLYGWKSLDIFQAALQEELSKAVDGTLDSYREKVNMIVDQAMNKLLERLMEQDGGVYGVSTKELNKISIDFLNVIKTINKEAPSGKEKEHEDERFANRLKKRLQYSRTGERFRKRMQQIDNEEGS